MLSREVYHGNSIEALIIAASITAGVVLIVWGLRAALRHRLKKAEESERYFDDFLHDVANRTKLFLVFFIALFLGIRALDLPPELVRGAKIAAHLALIAQLTLWATGLVDLTIRRYRRRRMETDPEAVTTLNVFRIGAVATLWVVAALVTIRNVLEQDITALITGLGIGGIAVALATQNILADLFASLSIVIDKPFVVGDFIIVGESMGTVEHIGLKTTHIRSLSGEQLIIGNGDLLKSRIRNFKRMAERRVVLRLGVTYQTPADQLEQIPTMIRNAIEKHQTTRFDRSHMTGFGDSSYDFEAVYWILSPQYLDFANTHQAVLIDIVRTFTQEKVEFAYPTRTLFVTQS
jgi:small-conductance mechanosensitive channel